MYANVVLSDFTRFFSRRCVSKSSNLTKAQLHFDRVDYPLFGMHLVRFVTFDTSSYRPGYAYIIDLMKFF